MLKKPDTPNIPVFAIAVAMPAFMYLGWLGAGTMGVTVVGIAFILPSFLMVLALEALYVHFASLPWIQGMFYGIGSAVIAIIVRSAIKLVRTTVGKDWLLWTIFATLAITTAWIKSEIVLLFVLCGVVAMIIVLFGAPHCRRVARNRRVKAFVQGVTGAAVGGIAGAAYILARRSLVDIPTVLIGIVTLAVLIATKNVWGPILILPAGAVGVLLHGIVE